MPIPIPDKPVPAAATAPIAGVPHKGYDDRAPKDGYKMAAGMNELFSAPLLASQKGSYDWDESINAITRHVIEEFSNLQHFVPYLYERCTLLGAAGLNWVPTLGTWLQNNHRTADSASIGFYHTLEKLALKQVNITGTLPGYLVDETVHKLNRTIVAGHKALTAVSEKLARKTFAPVSNVLTKLSNELTRKNHWPRFELQIFDRPLPKVTKIASISSAVEAPGTKPAKVAHLASLRSVMLHPLHQRLG